MAKALEVRVGGAADALDRFEAAWNRAVEGRAAKNLEVLSFADLSLLLKNLTPARWALLERLRAEGPMSVYELSKRLARDYKNVHTDVARLVALGIVERRGVAQVALAWDLIRAQFPISAPAAGATSRP